MAWAKLNGDHQLPLAHHCADVAYVFRALADRPVTRARLAFAAGQTALADITLDRLAVLAFLHDFGKANHGFQARSDPRAPPIGHLSQTRWLFQSSDPVAEQLIAACGFFALEGFAQDENQEFLEALLAHHGKPASMGKSELDRKFWLPVKEIDPLVTLKELGAVVRRLFPQAFIAGGEIVPHQPAFIHAFAGLLNLADWIGSDERLFPVRDDGDLRISRA